jgi:hypothetical protein
LLCFTLNNWDFASCTFILSFFSSVCIHLVVEGQLANKNVETIVLWTYRWLNRGGRGEGSNRSAVLTSPMLHLDSLSKHICILLFVIPLRKMHLFILVYVLHH